MKIEFIAQSGFIITLDNGKVLTIDAWLSNPVNPKTINDIPKTDYVFITHDHGDHDLKTGIELAKRDDSVFISNYTIMKFTQDQGVNKIAPGNIGGFYEVDSDLEVAQVRADHSSDIGNPVGFLIKSDNKIIYHMGDTGYMSEFKTLGELYEIDILMIPIGSRYTMDPLQASIAVRDLKPKKVIPMHYNTFDKIAQDPDYFKGLVEKLDIATEVLIMEPGDVQNIK